MTRLIECQLTAKVDIMSRWRTIYPIIANVMPIAQGPSWAVLLVIWTLTTSGQGCNETLTDPEGVITSPGFPAPYTNNTDCWWRFEAPEGKIVLLNFSYLQTDCDTDLVIVYDGYDNYWAIFAELCSLKNDSYFASSTNWLYVTFISGESRPGDGFIMTYSFYSLIGIFTGRGPLAGTGVWWLSKPIRPSGWRWGVWLSKPISPFGWRWGVVAFKTYQALCLEGCVAFKTYQALWLEVGCVAFKTYQALCLEVGCVAFKSYQALWLEVGCVAFKTYQALWLEVGCGGFQNLSGPLSGGRVCGFQNLSGPLAGGGVCGFQNLSGPLSGGGVCGFQNLSGPLAGGCGAYHNKSPGVIVSPDYPDTYPGGIACKWLIEAPIEEIILLKFLNISTECWYDIVTIYDGNNIANASTYFQFCRMDQDMYFASSTNFAYVTFTSDLMEGGLGFELTYLFYKCSEMLTEPNGVLMSPEYPSNYPNHFHCSWTIVADERKQIVLTLEDVNTECNYDYVYVYDGSNNNATLLNKFCEANNAILNSTTNVLYILIQSDESVTYKGFNASYYFTGAAAELIIPFGRTIFPIIANVMPIPQGPSWAALLVIWTLTTSGQGCNEILTDPEGVIISPGFPAPYPNTTDCWWRIEAPEGKIVLLNFSYLQIDCDTDLVIVYDGYDSYWPIIAELCSLQNDSYFASSTNWFYVTFISGESQRRDGFIMTYSFYNCIATLTESSGVISSPYYPKNYPNNLHCSWTIRVIEGYTVVVT
ncbi:Deleted in malignant brain tumors 1 protein, partial [Bulinus truncatus]